MLLWRESKLLNYTRTFVTKPILLTSQLSIQNTGRFFYGTIIKGTDGIGTTDKQFKFEARTITTQTTVDHLVKKPSHTPHQSVLPRFGLGLLYLFWLIDFRHVS